MTQAAVHHESVGIAAPGLGGWSASLDVLRGATPHVPTAESPYAPALLPPNERRRATAAVRQAFRAAEDAVTALRARTGSHRCSPVPMRTWRCSTGSAAALAQTPRVISPTDFHNSVHNAASGYWSIAVQSMLPTTTLAAFDASFTAGLIEAAALARERNGDVLLVAYDAVAPQPLLAKRPLGIPPASRSCSARCARWHRRRWRESTLDFAGDRESRLREPALEAMRARKSGVARLAAAGTAGRRAARAR